MELHPKSKIEKVVGNDPTVGVLLNPWLRRTGEDSGVLVASTGQNAVVIPVSMSSDDVEGPVPVDALKELRKVKGGVLRCEEQYCILPSGAAYPRANHPMFPPVEQLLVDSGVGVVEVALNAKALYEAAQAMGAEVVKLKFEVAGEDESLDFVGKTVGIEPHPSEPHIEGARSSLLPYRVARI